MNWSSITGLGMGVSSTLSAVGSASIPITFCVFPHLLKKQAYEVVNYFAIATFLSSIGSMVGLPDDGTAACWFEGIVTSIFILSSIGWNHMIAYSLYSVVIDQPFNVSWKMHVVCWLFPIILTFLPLINSRYGNSGGNWCFISDDDRSPAWAQITWIWVSFYCWIWIGVLLNMYMLVRVYLASRSLSPHIYRKVSKVLRKFWLYPLITIVVWSVSTVQSSMYSVTGGGNDDAFRSFSNIEPCFQGILTSIVFWLTMRNVRKQWHQLVTITIRESFLSSFKPRIAPALGNTPNDLYTPHIERNDRTLWNINQSFQLPIFYYPSIVAKTEINYGPDLKLEAAPSHQSLYWQSVHCDPDDPMILRSFHLK